MRNRPYFKQLILVKASPLGAIQKNPLNVMLRGF
jgi:hypothetical protein